MDEPSSYLNTAELAELLRIKEQTARVWRLRGTGPPFIRLGSSRRGRVVFELGAVKAWLASRSFRSNSQESARDQRDNPTTVTNIAERRSR